MRRINSRKGVELAINSIVVIIIGIVILSAGVFLVYKIVNAGQTTSEQLSSDVKRGLREELAQGQLVAVYPGSQNIEGNERSTTGVMIQNRLDAADFKATVKGFAPDETQIDDTWFGFLQPGNIPKNGVGEFIIIFNPPDTAAKGIYTFTVEVFAGSDKYGTKRSFTVNYR